MCGVVDGGIIDGPVGLRSRPERRRRHLRPGSSTTPCRPPSSEAARSRGVSLHEHLTRVGAAQAVGEHGLLALDWHNGNRSVLVNHELSGLIVGLTVTTTARGRLPRADGGDRVRCAHDRRGVRPRRASRSRSSSWPAGLTKNGLLMQIYADVLRLPLSVIGSEQGPALGSAIHAAVAAGAYRRRARGRGPRWVGSVRRVRAESPATPTATTSCSPSTPTLHDHFGRGGNDVMHTSEAPAPEVAAADSPRRTSPSRVVHDDQLRPSTSLRSGPPARRARGPARRARPLRAGGVDGRATSRRASLAPT